jgi:uncharacterized protein YggE
MSTRIRYAGALSAFIILAAVGIVAIASDAKPHAAPVSRTGTTTNGATTNSPQSVSLAASTTASTLTVVGTGSASGVPDQATVSLGVAATRPNVHDAVAAANADMAKLIASLHKSGVQDKDIQTTGLSIYQQTNCCPQYVAGYNSTNQVNVTIHHLSNIGSVITAAVDAVGNEIQLNGVNLYVSDPSAQVKAARAAAMADAGARSQEWARLAGRHVGALISLSEIISVTPSYCDQCGGKGGAGGGGAPVFPGQTLFVVTITAVYELLP